jgi:hypothetical protein
MGMLATERQQIRVLPRRVRSAFMFRFIVTPEDDRTPPKDVDSRDAAGVLRFVENMGCTAADVATGGVHLFSLILADNGLWSISNATMARRRLVSDVVLVGL